MKPGYHIILLAGICLLSACSGLETERNDTSPAEQNPITINACTGGYSREVVGELLPTRSAPKMEDFPDEAAKDYKEPVALFGFFLQDKLPDDEALKEYYMGCFGETKDSIINNLVKNISDQHKADVLQQTFGTVSPKRGYETFMQNAVYVYSDKVNPPQGAFVSNDIAAFWRPNAYHYFISYAPPLPDANLVEPLVLSLKTSAHGVQGEPDYNFLYGRRVLQYNDAKAHKPDATPPDPHPYHKTDGVTIKLAPMLAQLVFHLKCDGKLTGSAVLFGFRVTTYKEAKFHLDTGVWELGNSADVETITRYYDDDYIIPSSWTVDGNAFSLSLFPNLEEAGLLVTTETPVVVKKLEVCVNNTWCEVFDMEEHEGEIGGEHSKVGTVVPLVPSYKTDVYLTVSPKNTDEWNKLIVTFSNWKRDDIHEFNGTLE